MYGTAEADREKSLWPTAELNVSGTTFITLLNNPSALSQLEKNRIIFGVSTCASARSGRKTHRKLHASLDYTDNSWEFKNILMCSQESEARLSHDSRLSEQSLECLTQRPDCVQQELGTKLAWFHRSLLKSGDRAQHDYLFLFSAPPHITIKTVLRWQLAERDSKGAENYQENTISRKQHTCFWLYRKVFCQKKKTPCIQVRKACDERPFYSKLIRLSVVLFPLSSTLIWHVCKQQDCVDRCHVGLLPAFRRLCESKLEVCFSM